MNGRVEDTTLEARKEGHRLMGAKDTNLETHAFPSPADWEQWLAENHATCPGLWLKIAKKGSGIASVAYDEALEAALCYGWIDGQKAKFDEVYWLQRFSPRRPNSKWSKINRNKAERLMAAGRMKPAGLREVDRARADGRWEAAYEGQRTMQVPDDLRLALEDNEPARLFFETVNSRNRYAILYRIQDAKKPETRARRIEQFVRMLSEQKVLYP
jgi:uncharacterized protein YdeI (YjbR/CyaY-like superfamily)